MGKGKGVAIIGGLGYVGKAMQKIFEDALIYDIGTEDRKGIINKTCGLAIICVPTPMTDDSLLVSSADCSIVEDTVKWLETPLILIKSTVPPGTTERLSKKYKKRICFSPEYIGEGGYYIPPRYPDPTNPLQHEFMVVGGKEEDCNEIISRFSRRLGPSKTYFICSSNEAELIKYMENSWIATKITFVNEWFDICKKFKGNFYKVREGWLLDSRVEKSHTMVFPEKRGFTGKCIPKDMGAIVAASEAAGFSPSLLISVLKTNSEKLKP